MLSPISVFSAQTGCRSMKFWAEAQLLSLKNSSNISSVFLHTASSLLPELPRFPASSVMIGEVLHREQTPTDTGDQGEQLMVTTLLTKLGCSHSKLLLKEQISTHKYQMDFWIFICPAIIFKMEMDNGEKIQKNL